MVPKTATPSSPATAPTIMPPDELAANVTATSRCRVCPLYPSSPLLPACDHAHPCPQEKHRTTNNSWPHQSPPPHTPPAINRHRQRPHAVPTFQHRLHPTSPPPEPTTLTSLPPALRLTRWPPPKKLVLSMMSYVLPHLPMLTRVPCTPTSPVPSLSAHSRT